MTARGIRLSAVNSLRSFWPQYDFPWGVNEMKQTEEGIKIVAEKSTD